jgi:hypothetical protein
MSKPVGGPAGRGMPVSSPLSAAHRAALRQCVLAVSVLHEVDVLPTDDGVVLTDIPQTHVTFADIAAAIGNAAADSPTAQRRLLRWMRLRRAVAERSLDELSEAARPVGLPVGHELHTGPSWVRQPVLGGSLDVGVGFVGLFAGRPETVSVMPQSVLDAAEIDPSPWWRGATEYLENMGALATSRWRRDPRSPLRPMGDCDVVTLLASALFRGALCADAGGMRAIAAPVRNRGWLDLSRIDPAFALTAAAISDDESRGFERPVLLTVDEVAMVPEGGRPAEIVLRDPVSDQQRWLRDVLYH